MNFTEKTLQQKQTPFPSNRETLVDQITSWIAERIIEGEFEPGEELGISQLAEELGVSPTPVWEALRSLQSEGLIELPPRRSPRVTKLTRKDVLDIYSCRAYLIGLAAKLASEHMNAEALETLDQLVSQMLEATQQNDIHKYFQLTVRFNDVIVACADNQVLDNLITSLGRRTLRLRYLSITAPGRVQAGLDFHHELLNAFRKGDTDQAEHLMKNQILKAQAVLLESHFSQIDEPYTDRS